jgi:signal transduction histidine kinase
LITLKSTKSQFVFIVRAVAKTHDGIVEVASDEESGTTFAFRFRR